MNLKSLIRFETTTVQLCVKHESATGWRWCVCLPNRGVLVNGISKTQLAAKLAAQHAFEERLYRAGLTRYRPDAYSWKDLLVSS